MPRASKRKISQKVLLEISNNLTGLISSLKKDDYIAEFIDTFLTKEEKVMISKRLMLYILLEKGLSINQIMGILRISRQTFFVHKKNWIKSGGLYQQIIKYMGNSKKKSTFWEKVNDSLYPLELVMESRNNMQARAKLYQGDFSKREKNK